jgi:16S rRNA (cytosine967-C5)-methyltransferase
MAEMTTFPGNHSGLRQEEKILRETVAILGQLGQGGHLQDLLEASPLNGPLLQNTASTICRYQARYNWIIDQAAPMARNRQRHLLQWVLCQHLHLRTLPAQAAATAAVTLARRAYHQREAGFINAVLRQLLAVPAELWAARIEETAPAAVRLDFGEALHGQWSSEFPAEKLAEWAKLLRLPAPPALRLRRGHVCPPDLIGRLHPLPPLSPWSEVPMWEIREAAAFFNHPQFSSGLFYFQDPATLAAPALLAAAPGETIADLCCAPGGKTLLIAEMMQGEGVLICRDRSDARLDRVRHNLAEYGGLCQIAAGDAAAPGLPDDSLDGLLLDVPCSNTGVLRRRPDVRQHFSRTGLAELVLVQAALLDAGAHLIRPGGRLV